MSDYSNLHAMLANPYAYSFALGFLAGMGFMRRLTRWTLGGRA